MLVVGGIGAVGISATFFSSAELYDPAANGGVGAWTPTGSLAIARFGHTATLLQNGRVLVEGGVGIGGDRLASAEIFQ